jgi:hypothetical protein
VVRNLSVAIVNFVLCSFLSVLLLANYPSYDFLSNYHNKFYLLKIAIKIKDATNNRILNLPKGMVVKLNKDYEGSALVSTDGQVGE